MKIESIHIPEIAKPIARSLYMYLRKGTVPDEKIIQDIITTGLEGYIESRLVRINEDIIIYEDEHPADSVYGC